MAKIPHGTGNGAMASTQMTAFGAGASNTGYKGGNQTQQRFTNDMTRRNGTFGNMTMNSSQGFQGTDRKPVLLSFTQ